MPFRVAKRRRNDVVSFRNTKGKTRCGAVLRDQIAPSTPASSTSTTGGTLAAATYSYRISVVYGTMESAPSVAKTQVTTGATSTVTIDWTGLFSGVPAPTSVKIYGRTGGSELLMGTVAWPTLNFVDTGAVTPSGALPADTGQVLIKQYTGNPNVSAVPKATTYKGTTVYWKR
jgi:hypothetical protein